MIFLRIFQRQKYIDSYYFNTVQIYIFVQIHLFYFCMLVIVPYEVRTVCILSCAVNLIKKEDEKWITF